MKNTGDNSSCSWPRQGRQKAAVLFGLIAVGGIVGALFGHAQAGLIFGLLLGAPLIGGGG